MTKPDPDFEEKRPNLGQRALLLLANVLPMHALGVIPGVISLVARRSVMQSINLYSAPLPPSDGSTPSSMPAYRTPLGDGNDADHYATGASSTAFGRNMPPASSFDPLDGPAPQVVAAKLLQRDRFRPAGMQLNIMAAAWIQAMAHDWFGHIDDDSASGGAELADGTPACPMRAFRFRKTVRRADGAFDNFRTHWWDASFVYGQDDAAVKRARTGKGGRLKVGPINGAVPKDGDFVGQVGDAKNGWAGVAMLQDLFLREHNAIADAIVNQHPEWAEDDDKVFNYARLAVAAIVAKVHTVDWTVELLKTKTLDVGMNSNWYGLPKALGLPFAKGPPAIFGLVANDTENHDVPYCLTEEFVSVYRLHSLLPDGVPVDDAVIPLRDLVGMEGDKRLNTEGMPSKLWDAMVRLPCGNLELFNYPRDLRDLAPTDADGRPLDEHVDLAALDIYRDRERGIRRYNDFRRGLHMKPVKSIEDLVGGKDAEAYKPMVEVYGEDGIEQVDLQVGMLAEKKIEGFAISETAFYIFLLMASRRLEADRFFTTDFNAETYSDIGLQWVQSVKGLRDVLKRHFPEVEKLVPDGTSAFKPRDEWKKEHM